jgi:hypothetical protein
MYLRTALQERFLTLHLRHEPAISISKRLRGVDQGTERFAQPPKPENATSDSWNLTRLVEVL